MTKIDNISKSLSRIVSLAIIIFIFSIDAFCAPQLTPEQVAQKTAAVISSSGGIEVSFTLQSAGQSGKGEIKSSGSKFMVSLPGISNWYNGKDLYTYNSKTGETTVVAPTARELLEVNPLLYVKNGASGYDYSFSTVKRNGKYVIDLTPKNKKSEIKKMTFTINSTSFEIERISVTTSGGVTIVDINSFKKNMPIKASEFEYPKSKYPKAEIVDLR